MVENNEGPVIDEDDGACHSQNKITPHRIRAGVPVCKSLGARSE